METTGFSVKIREKKRLHVLEMLAAAATTTSPSKFADLHKLCQAGSCIPRALACLGSASPEKAVAKLSQDSLPENVYMKETHGQTHKQSSVLCKCKMGTVRTAWRSVSMLWDVNATFQLTGHAFLDALRRGADSSTVAFCLHSAPPESTVGSAVQLIAAEVGQMLDMAAGALGCVLRINVSGEDPVMVPDINEEMQDMTQHIACNTSAGKRHCPDTDARVTVDQFLLNELAEEAVASSKCKSKGTFPVV